MGAGPWLMSAAWAYALGYKQLFAFCLCIWLFLAVVHVLTSKRR